MNPDPSRKSLDKKAHERAVAAEVVRLIDGLDGPAPVETVDDEHPDVAYERSGGAEIGIECTSYYESMDPQIRAWRAVNQLRARELTGEINSAWSRRTGQERVRIVPRYNVGPESDRPFPSKTVWPPLIEEIMDACAVASVEPRTVWMGQISSDATMIREHLTGLSLSDSVFAGDNYMTARANLNEHTIVSAIDQKATAQFSDRWAERWLIIHAGRVADGGVVHEFLPSLRMARDARHENAAAAAKKTKFDRIFIYGLGGAAELDFETGGYRLFEYDAASGVHRVSG